MHGVDADACEGQFYGKWQKSMCVSRVIYQFARVTSRDLHTSIGRISLHATVVLSPVRVMHGPDELLKCLGFV